MASNEAEGGLETPRFEGDAPRLLLVAAPFYRGIADDLIAGARAEIEAAGGAHELVEVPGALEIPAAIRLAARRGGHDGFVALGCVIRGETYHFELVCNESARGITELTLEGLAVGNGIITTETVEQARARSDPGRLNKGGGAAAAALHLIALARRFGG